VFNHGVPSWALLVEQSWDLSETNEKLIQENGILRWLKITDLYRSKKMGSKMIKTKPA
jgi:hypothetical protein